MRLNRGFTLIEVLVAMAILSIGLLSLAGLKLISARNNQVAYHQGLAAIQAEDMAERIRVNHRGATLGAYSDLGLGSPTGTGCAVGVGTASPTVCTHAQLAIEDHRQWARMNQYLLPQGNGTVVCEEGPASANCEATSTNRWLYRITVRWTEKIGGAPVTESFVYRATP